MDTTPLWVLACMAIVMWIVLVVAIVRDRKKEF